MTSTHSRAGSDNESSTLDITTALSALYGVFVSQKSYLIGLMTLIRREHARMLVMKVAGHKLPVELVEIIEEQAISLEKRTVREKWDPKLRIEDLIARFERWDHVRYGATTPAERRVFERVANMNISAKEIHLSRPVRSSIDSPSYSHLIHLTAHKSRPSLVATLPQAKTTSLTTPPSTAGAFIRPWTINYPLCASRPSDHSGYNLLLRTSVGPNWSPDALRALYGHHFLSKSTTRTEVDGSASALPARRADAVDVRRLVQVEGIEDVIRDWDAEGLKAFVEMLELRVVPFQDGGDELKPGLHVVPEMRIWRDTEGAGSG